MSNPTKLPIAGVCAPGDIGAPRPIAGDGGAAAAAPAAAPAPAAAGGAGLGGRLPIILGELATTAIGDTSGLSPAFPSIGLPLFLPTRAGVAGVAGGGGALITPLQHSILVARASIPFP